MPTPTPRKDRIITDAKRILRRMQIACAFGKSATTAEARRELHKGYIHYLTWRTREGEKMFADMLPFIQKHIEQYQADPDNFFKD